MEKDNLIENEERTSLSSTNVYPQIIDDKIEVEHHTQREHDPSIQQFPSRQSSELRTVGSADIQAPDILDNDGQLETQIVFPKHHSGIAWLSLLFCCFPLSIPAVYWSDKTIKAIRKGDVLAARRYSYLARKFASFAIIFGIFVLMLAATLFYLHRFDVWKKL